MSASQSSTAPDPFQQVIDCLRKDGLVDEAGKLHFVLHEVACTTGTELIGEFGRAMKRIWPAVRARGSRESRAAMKAAARLVRKSWRFYFLWG